MSSKHLLLLILRLVVLAAPALADDAKPTELGKRKRPSLGHTPPQGPEAPSLTPELLEKLFPGRHYHGFMLHHRPGPQGPELFKRPIQGRHNPPPHVKPTPPPHWNPPPFAMPPPSPPPDEPGSPGPAPKPSEKLFPGRHHLLAHASFVNHGHQPAHSLVLHHGSHHRTHLPIECYKGPHMCRLPVIPTEYYI
ncbi:AP2/ERF domain-containing protein [Psidium guajava]|nr:AP2/ERF domain-containing protein [Psidium guajava]